MYKRTLAGCVPRVSLFAGYPTEGTTVARKSNSGACLSFDVLLLFNFRVISLSINCLQRAVLSTLYAYLHTHSSTSRESCLSSLISVSESKCLLLSAKTLSLSAAKRSKIYLEN